MADFNRIDQARKLLGLDEYATAKDIKDAYRKLALKYHPDRCKGKRKKEHEEKLKEIIGAHTVLMNYCAGYKYSFKERDVKRQAMSKALYEHLKRFYDGWWADLGLE